MSSASEWSALDDGEIFRDLHEKFKHCDHSVSNILYVLFTYKKLNKIYKTMQPKRKMPYTYEMLHISSAFIVFVIFVSQIDDMQQGTNLDFANQ